MSQTPWTRVGTCPHFTTFLRVFYKPTACSGSSALLIPPHCHPQRLKALAQAAPWGHPLAAPLPPCSNQELTSFQWGKWIQVIAKQLMVAKWGCSCNVLKESAVLVKLALGHHSTLVLQPAATSDQKGASIARYFSVFLPTASPVGPDPPISY